MIVVAGGCAATPDSQPPAEVAQYTQATALCFDPPIAAGQPPLDLWRDGRGVAAFHGYQGLTTTYSYLHVDDRQTSDYTDRYIRRSVINSFGVMER